MGKVSFDKHLPKMCKFAMFLDTSKKKFNKYLISIRIFSNVLYIMSTFSCLNKQNSNPDEEMSKLQDLVYLITLLLIEATSIFYKDDVCKIIEFVMQPLTNNLNNSVRAKVVRQHEKELTFYSYLIIALGIAGGSIIYISTISSLILNKPNDKCTRLVMGWVSFNDNNSYYTLLLLNALSVFSLLVSVFQWFLIMNTMVFKLKYTIRILCADLEVVNESLDCSTESNRGARSVNIYKHFMKDREIGDVCNLPRFRKIKVLPKPENTIDVRGQTLMHMIMVEQKEYKIRDYFSRTVKQHIEIIRFVKLTDKTYRLSFLFSNQLGAIVVALGIPNISSLDELLSPGVIQRLVEVFVILGSLGLFNLYGRIVLNELDELLSPGVIQRLVEVFVILGSLGLFNLYGQIILNESESLRQALYNCDWTDKPYSLRRGLLIMQIMASKPLRLTIGGMYTLGMETFARILNATYSYASFIQTLSLE